MKTVFVGLILAALVLPPGGARGQTVLGGVAYDLVDPGEPFTEQPDPPQNWESPAASRSETAAGLLAFQTADPGDIVPGRRPRAEEHREALSAFLTPGEDEPVWFAVHALADLRALEVAVDLGKAPVATEVRHIHTWPQRTGWRSRRWYMTPELLLPCRAGKRSVPGRRGVLEEQPFNLAAGSTGGFWLTLTAPPDAAPGTYDATVTVATAGRPAHRLPLRIEVLPFVLQRPPDRYWLLYGDSARWRGMREDQVMAELRDFARHGMTGLVEGSLGNADLDPLPAGQPRFDATGFRALARQCREAGMPGPHVCSLGGVPEQVQGKLGLSLDLTKGPWPEALQAGVTAVSKAAVAATADEPAGWLFYGVDEPSGDNTYAIQDYQCWRRGGAATYATFYQLGFLEKAAEFLTAPCFVVGLISQEKTARQAREACIRTGAEFWWYGTGCYANPFPQERYMAHNRYGAGLLFWKTGAKAQVSWTFCRPHGDVFNDFDGSRENSAEPKEQITAYPHLLAPDDWSTYQGAIPTIAWESLREGVDDYRYLYTATVLAREAAASPDEARRAAGREAQATLAALAEAVPWANPMDPMALKAERLQQVRRVTADLIVGLQTAPSGESHRQGPAKRPLKLEITTQAPAVPAAPAGVLAVLPAPTPPSIDGRLDEPAWQAAAAVTDFRDSQSGRPATVPTAARVLCSDEALYVAFECTEPAMGSLVAKQQGHDTPEVWLDDGVELFIAGVARRPYAHLIVNTRGSLYDEVNQGPSWDPAAKAVVQRGDKGWAVEIAVPWADLAAVGVTRSPRMTINLCRNRFAVADEAAHTAWSCTFGGFHTPERFGMALLQAGPVALTAVAVPTEWGAQAVAVTLRNLTTAPLTAQVGLDGRFQTVALAAGASAAAQVALALRTQGPQTLRLEWGVAGQAPSGSSDLVVDVPAPIALPDTPAFASARGVLDVPVTVNLAAADRRDYRLRVALGPDAGGKAVNLRPEPGLHRRLAAKVERRAAMTVSLVDRRNGSAVATIERSLFVVDP